MRPLDFMVPFWGKRYRECFVDLCLPPLLAPHNLALLRAQDGHRFLIATTPDDWAAIEHLPIMQTLRRHATPIWVNVSGPSTEAPAGSIDHYLAMVAHQNHSQKALLEAAYPRRAFGSLLFPDVVFSDFMVASIIKHAEAGCRLVVAPAMRQGQEGVLGDLMRLGYMPCDRRPSQTAECISIPQRVLADLAVKHVHPEMWRFDGRLVQSFPMPLRYWPIAGNRGLLFHTFFVAFPALIDFDILTSDHTDCLNEDLLENIYFSRNFADCDRIHVVRDSDEFTLVSLTPESENRADADETGSSSLLVSQLRRLANIRETMRSYVGQPRDSFRRELFRHPIRVHGGELDEVWRREERRIERQIRWAVGDYYKVSDPPSRRNQFPSKPAFIDYVLCTYSFLQSSPASRFLAWCAEALRRLNLVLRGDEAARRWLKWRIQVFRGRLRGDASYPPRPDGP